MSRLLYGILFAGSDIGREISRGTLPPGVGGAPLGVIEQGGLGAAVSAVDAPELSPTLASVLAFARVVQALHAACTTLPMRFGCVLPTEAAVVDLLRTRCEHYAEVLRGIDGCVEMGVRVLVDSPEPAATSESDHQAAALRADRRVSWSGSDYLARRKKLYAAQDQRAEAAAEVLERIRSAFGELCLRCKTECSPGLASPSLFRTPLAALYFLLRRESLDAFRSAFRQIERAERARLLLSGPWPPFNFVEPEREVARYGWP